MYMFGRFKKDVKIEESNFPLLRVMVRDIHIADLYHDGKDYCLTYKEAFKTLSIPALNPENLKMNETVEVDKCYKSKNLWYVFQERLHSLDRADVVTQLKRYGLTKNSDPLLILGKLGQTSISKPWYLELKSKIAE